MPFLIFPIGLSCTPFFFLTMYTSRQFQSPEYQYNPHNPPWQKLLWVRQNYPDNYVDETFLDELQRNGKNCHVASILLFIFFFIYIQHVVNVRSYDYWTTVFESGVITQQISSVVIFIAIFIYLQNNIMSGHHLIWTGSLSTGIGYIFWDLIMLKTRNNYEFKRKIIERI